MIFDARIQDVPTLASYSRKVLYRELLSAYSGATRKNDILGFKKSVESTFSNRRVYNSMVQLGAIVSNGPIKIRPSEPEDEQDIIYFDNLMFDEKKSLALDAMAYYINKRVEILSSLHGVKSLETKIEGHDIALDKTISDIGESTIYDITPYEFQNYYVALLNERG